MDYFIYYVIGGVVLVLLIIQFDRQQKRKIKNILQESKDVSPLFMIKASEQKINALNAKLYAGGTTGSVIALAPVGTSAADIEIRQSVAKELKAVVMAYKSKQINVQEYNKKLDELLIQLA